ncbi:MAG: ATP-binding cassette domain-containing protein, partial [Candidatus Riflebacteria bacterium]|nr:ATP-binding cassette domain-containing protein [Candidatus Riflebacteria bacterium]
MSAISFNKVVKNYGSKLALDGFSLNIKEGEIFALAGLNGAGKTTAIKSLLQLVNIKSGQISLFSAKLNRAEIGFAPEVPDIPEFFSVKE